MDTLKSLSRLPRSLSILLCVFAIVPFWSLTFVDLPWIAAQNHGWPYGLLVAFTYWVAPFAICTFILRASIWLLPIFALECLAIIAHSVINHSGSPEHLQIIRYVLLAAMAGIGFLVLNRDTLYPVMARSKRLWRKRARIYANARIMVSQPDSKETAAALMQDCSLSGLGFSLDSQVADKVLQGKKKGDALLVSIKQGKEVFDVNCRISWFRSAGGVRQVGVETDDEQTMGSLIKLLYNPQQAPGLSGWFARQWASTGFRRAATAIWAVSVAGSMGMPACGTKHDNKRGGGESGSMSAIDHTQAEVSEGGKIARNGSAANRKKTAVSENHGFGLTFVGPQVNNGIALAYTGRALAYQDCDGASGHLNDYLDQGSLLALYEDGKGWFDSAISSLEEHDGKGVKRSITAVHSDFKLRLNNGTDPKFWDMVGIRIRLGDTPHIKIAYELPVRIANPANTLRYAGFIHAIAIPKEDVNELVADLNSIPQDQARSGCEIKRKLIDKWVIDRGSYWFLHTNVLDTNRNAWIWTELKPVTDDNEVIKTGCASSAFCNEEMFADMDDDGIVDMMDMCPDSGGNVDTMGCPMMDFSGMMDGYTDMDGYSSMDSYSDMGYTDMMSGFFLAADPGRTIAGALDVPSGSSHSYKLRIVPMLFKRLVWDETTKSAKLKGAAHDIARWFDTSADILTLAEGPNGESLDPTHPIFGNEEAHTCAGCHVRNTLAGPGYATDSASLDIVRSMGFRHMAYGGHIAQITENLGVQRPDYRADFSPYLADAAFVRTNKQEWPDATQPEPNMYQYRGAASNAGTGCSPYLGCDCDKHQQFAQCLVDVIDIGQRSNLITRPFNLQVNNLAAESLRHAKECKQDAENEALAARACDMLRCVAQAAHDGFALELEFGGVVRNDPTFGCKPFSPFLEAAEF